MLNAETQTKEQQTHTATTSVVRPDQTTYDQHWWDGLGPLGSSNGRQQGVSPRNSADDIGESPSWRRDSIGLDRRRDQDGSPGLRSDVLNCNCCWCHNMNDLSRALGSTPNELGRLLLRLLQDEARRQADWRRNSDGWGTFG